MATESEALALFRNFFDAMSKNDWDRLGTMLHPDYVEDWPQSGEQVRGLRNIRAIVENYPEGFTGGQVETLYVVGSEDNWIMSPTFTLLKVSGVSDRWTAVTKAKYPDGSTWFVIMLGVLQEGVFTKASTFFAPVYPPPEWRRSWVDLI